MKNKINSKTKKSNKAQFFSIDAMIALSIIIIVVMAIYPTIRTTRRESSLPSDIITAMNSMKIGEVQGINLAQMNITNPDKLLIEQIGEFYLTDINLAINLSETVLSSISPNENIGIWYGNTLLASRNITPLDSAKNVFTQRQIVSGIGGIAGVTGMSTRAYLSSSARTDYKYFGGYVGEGNVTVDIVYSGNISSATIELVTNKNFEIIVNGNSQGNFQGSPNELTPMTYNLSTSDFSSGSNTVELIASNLHISGGFIKVVYDSDITYEQPSRYYFPGIKGAINLYDGFYVPGDLKGLEIFLRFNNTIETFLLFGNITVFNSSTSGVESFTISNSTLFSILDYSKLSRKTIPLRFGMENTSYVENMSKDIDVFSITDISGSMAEGCNGGGFFCCWASGDWCGSESTCNSCGGTLENRIQDAKNANKAFIDMILNDTANRVGLSAYAGSAPDSTYHPLSNDNVSLKSEVDSWVAGGGTCICCGVNKGIAGLVANSSLAKFRSLVVMSDGEANVQCAEQGTGSSAGDAVQSACDAYNNHGIKVYTIGFGSEAGTQTLTDMAACGDGSFFSTVDDLESIYEKIAEELIATAYYEQTIEVSGDYMSELFADSYVEFDYEKDPEPKGIVTTIEKQFLNGSHAFFDIPQNYSIVEATVVSYSGPYWTSKVKINDNEFFNLLDYREDFIKLGDPYSIQIPKNLINDSNEIYLGIGLGHENLSAGSTNNTVIYTISKEIASYNSVSAFAEGCNWHLEFQSQNTTMPIPEDYSGSTNCYYNSTGVACGVTNCYDSNDASQIAVYNLFSALDFDFDGILDVELSQKDLQVEISILEGIPFYHSTEVQIRKWN